MMATNIGGARKRALLYYPTISVPDGRWLRQAILYWDEIGSIVPETWTAGERRRFSTPETKYLEGIGQYRAFSPSDLLTDPQWSLVKKFHAEFEEIVCSEQFRSMSGRKPHEPRLSTRIHTDKISGVLLRDFLEPAGLAKPGRGYWSIVERKTALLYMSLLAKYLAAIDKEVTIPATDRLEYESLSYDCLSTRPGFKCISVLLSNALPVPRQDIPLVDIIDFKKRRRDELLHFRNELGAFRERLSEAESEQEAKEESLRFKENLERGVNDLSQIFEDSKLKATTGTLKSLISIKSPTLWGGIGTAMANSAHIANVPLSWAVPGLALTAAIEVGVQLVDLRNSMRANARQSGFAFVYRGHREKLFARNI
jgi:uncharacterized protein DUF6236